MFQVDDGGGVNNLSNTFGRALNVTAVNDAPTANALGTYAATANIQISFGAGSGTGLLVNSTDPEGTTLSMDTTPINVTAGASVTLNADGSFLVNPLPGSTSPMSFQYRVMDSGSPAPNLFSAYKTVSVTVSGPVVWFVDDSAAPAGNGTLLAPFQTLAAANTAANASGHRIFLYEGNYIGGVTLTNGVLLYGQGVNGASFDAVLGISPPAGSLMRPTINGADPVITTGGAGIHGISLAVGASNTIAGVTIGTTTGTKISSGANFGTLTVADTTLNGNGQALGLSAGTLAATFDAVSSTSGASGISLTNIGGTLTMNGGALSGSVGTEFTISGGNANVTYAGTITHDTAGLVNVTGATGGTKSFTGAISDGNDADGGGISLTNNTGAIISFSGGVQVSTSTTTAFTATGGGTVSVTGGNNTLSSVSATALNITNTTIGASDLNFVSITSGNNTAAADPVNGIVLNNSGSSGGLTVTGTGASTSGTAGTIAASLGTGGTIQNTTGDAISLTNVTGGVTLKSMIIGDSAADAITANANVDIVGDGITIVGSDNIVLENVKIGETGGHGIDGQNITNLSLTNVAILNSGNADNEDGLNFNGESTNQIDGTVLVKNSIISASYENNINISNTSGNLDLTIAGSTFGANHNPNGNDSVLVETLTTAQMDVVVTTSLFTSAAGDLFQFTANGTGGGTRDTLWFKDNTLSNNHPTIATGGGGTSIFSGSSGGFRFNIENNSFRDAVGHNVLIVKAANNAAVFEGYFQDNDIGITTLPSTTNNTGSKEGSALKIQTIGGGTLNVAVQDNNIFGYNNFGIELLGGGGASATGGNFFASVTGNTVAEPGNTVGTLAILKNGLHLNAGTTPGDTFLFHLNATGNNFSASGKEAVPPTGVGDIDIRLRQRQSTTVELPGYGGANNDNTAVAAFVDANNTGSDLLLVSNTVSTGGGGYINHAVRPLPATLPTPPLTLFAEQLGAGQSSKLTGKELAAIAANAIDRLVAAGASAAQLELLNSVSFQIVDFAGAQLGAAGAGVVQIDVNGAGWGYFVDGTPYDDSEFELLLAYGGRHADKDSEGYGRIDLLSVVLHELGHWNCLPICQYMLPAPGIGRECDSST